MISDGVGSDRAIDGRKGGMRPKESSKDFGPLGTFILSGTLTRMEDERGNKDGDHDGTIGKIRKGRRGHRGGLIFG